MTAAAAPLPFVCCLQLCFSPGSCDVLVSGGYDQAVKVWDCRSRSIDAIQVGAPGAAAWGS